MPFFQGDLSNWWRRRERRKVILSMPDMDQDLYCKSLVHSWVNGTAVTVTHLIILESDLPLEHSENWSHVIARHLGLADSFQEELDAVLTNGGSFVILFRPPIYKEFWTSPSFLSFVEWLVSLSVPVLFLTSFSSSTYKVPLPFNKSFSRGHRIPQAREYLVQITGEDPPAEVKFGKYAEVDPGIYSELLLTSVAAAIDSIHLEQISLFTRVHKDFPEIAYEQKAHVFLGKMVRGAVHKYFRDSEVDPGIPIDEVFDILSLFAFGLSITEAKSFTEDDLRKQMEEFNANFPISDFIENSLLFLPYVSEKLEKEFTFRLPLRGFLSAQYFCDKILPKEFQPDSEPPEFEKTFLTKKSPPLEIVYLWIGMILSETSDPRLPFFFEFFTREPYSPNFFTEGFIFFRTMEVALRNQGSKNFTKYLEFLRTRLVNIFLEPKTEDNETEWWSVMRGCPTVWEWYVRGRDGGGRRQERGGKRKSRKRKRGKRKRRKRKKRKSRKRKRRKRKRRKRMKRRKRKRRKRRKRRERRKRRKVFFKRFPRAA
jgi:hypothetical protein